MISHLSTHDGRDSGMGPDLPNEFGRLGLCTRTDELRELYAIDPLEGGKTKGLGTN